MAGAGRGGEGEGGRQRREKRELGGVQPILGSDERTPGWLGIQIPETSHIRRERIGREARAHVMLSFEDYHLLRIWSWDLIN